MFFIISILLTYLYADEAIISELISKAFLKKSKSALTSGELNKLIATVKKLTPTQFARLPKTTRNRILQSINVYGILPLNLLDSKLKESSLTKYFKTITFEDTETKLDVVKSTPRSAFASLANKKLNPFAKYQNFIHSIQKENLKLYQEELTSFWKEHNENWQYKEWNEAVESRLQAINYEWNGDSDDIIAAFIIPYSPNALTGDITIITVRGTGEYTFDNFPVETFVQWQATNDFGRNFWKYYFWPVYKKGK